MHAEIIPGGDQEPLASVITSISTPSSVLALVGGFVLYKAIFGRRRRGEHYVIDDNVSSLFKVCAIECAERF